MHRRHYIMSFEVLMTHFGLDGEVLRVWAEDDSDYLHILVTDPSAPETSTGGHVPYETVEIRRTGEPGDDSEQIHIAGPRT